MNKQDLIKSIREIIRNWGSPITDADMELISSPVINQMGKFGVAPVQHQCTGRSIKKPPPFLMRVSTGCRQLYLSVQYCITPFPLIV
jgi:hypothetical protein